jgi:UDP-N-acetyl-D-mannosaminuronic acid dehydrogenase
MGFKYDICIIGGCGHVGLPLGIAFARRGKKVVLFDRNADSVAGVNRGTMPFMENGAESALREVIGKTLTATTEPAVLGQSDALITAVATPVDTHLNPELNDIWSLIDQVRESVRDGQLFVLRSTVYPGITEYLEQAFLRTGKQPLIAFCPERIAEGHALEEISSLPQIVSGSTPEAVQRACDLFRVLTPAVVELKPREAELAKLFSNAWRYINFAVANQFYMLATQANLDFYRIYEAMTQDYPRLKGFPQPGFAAGPCLFKDTMQLAAFSDNNFFLGHAAMLVNEGLPNFILSRLKQRYPLCRMTIGIAGMAFKADSDDRRDSLSDKLLKILRLEAARVLCSDPYIRDPEFVEIDRLVEQSDLVVIGVPHRQYRHLRIDPCKVVDVWNFVGGTALQAR